MTDPAGTTQAGEPQSPELRLGTLLADSPRLRVSAAESCSGGRIAHRITSVAGSSGYFLGSIVAYANDAKSTLLHVPAEVLDRVGAVSAECALAMAEGSRRAFGSDLAVSTTGIAGPGGATARKPVGLVYIAVAGPLGMICEEHRFPGDRNAVVEAAAESGLRLLVSHVERALAALTVSGPDPQSA